MDPALDAVLQSWSFDPWLVFGLLASAGLYARGWHRLRQRGAARFEGRRLGCFLAGLLLVFLALASPLDAFAGLLLQVHMVQHLVLMMLVPPLLWLGEPTLPLLAGLPRAVRRHWVAPLFRSPLARAAWRRLTSLVGAWTLLVLATWFWHAPPLYEFALLSARWHAVEHLCFLGTALLFWWPVILPYPGRLPWSRWLLLPYLFLADVQNTLLSALLTFSSRVWYPHYAAVPRFGNQSALDDQTAAGALMWVAGSIAFLVPLLVLGLQLLYGPEDNRRSRPVPLRGGRSRPAGRISLPLLELPSPPLLASGAASARRYEQHRRADAAPLAHLRGVGSEGAKGQPPWDLLELPLIGRFLKWRHARTALQVPLGLLAAAVILDGLLGPQVAPMNLAGVLPWIHWRGFVVLGLLTAGNLFCLACPFTLPRSLARRWWPGTWRWPRPLRSKWLAAALVVLFFWAYEAFSLWNSPWWTAWITLGYFLAAFAVDACFQGSAFCKYLCPIGQFHFLQAPVSPLEVSVRVPARCAHCTTHDCLRGGPRGPGCGMDLFQPRKVGNLDCTFCLDCIHACPHENVGILARYPTAELLHDPPRSGVGRLSRRLDLAALALVLAFGAFVNATGMAGPVLQGEAHLAARLGLKSTTLVATGGLLTALLLLPALLVSAAAALGRGWSRDDSPTWTMAARFSFTLMPLGFGMWLAHYSYHFFPGVGGVIPVGQRLAADLGLTFLGKPAWQRACCTAGGSAGLLPLEFFFLDLGLLASLYLSYRTARALHPPLPRALRAFLPWAFLILLLFGFGVWVLLQPMAMRGMMG